MNRINKLFSEQKDNILSIYFTAGFPKLNDASLIIKHLQCSGANMIEVGIPFSDPLADGPIIQRSSEIALKNGMSLKVLFEQLKDIRKALPLSESVLPLILMSYLNPVLQFGMESFCKHANAIGIDGIIIPDLPILEYLMEYKKIFEKYGLINIFLITPQTPELRIRMIDDHSNGFIYMVSSARITGMRAAIDHEQENYFKNIRNMKLKNPVLIGFGISNNKSFKKASTYSNGVIIGSAFINAIGNSQNLGKDISNFIFKIKN